LVPVKKRKMKGSYKWGCRGLVPQADNQNEEKANGKGLKLT